MIDKDGAFAAPILDYEYTGPEDQSADYDAMRADFSETGSPRLAMGLNVGAQIHFQFETLPGLRHATDVTSLGAHTDLWNTYEKRFSSLVDRLGIAGKIANPRPP